MPCGSAVTITKAGVLPEHVVSLLTPQVIELIVTAYLSQHPEYKMMLPLRSTVIRETVTFYLGRLDQRIEITGNTVRVEFPRYARAAANTLSNELITLLEKAGDRLFAEQVKAALTAKFGTVQTSTATVNNQGEQQSVTAFRFRA